MTDSRPRICLVVAGMHRSGTSAVTGALGLLGAELPKRLLGSAHNNLKGHFEPAAIVDFDDLLLQSAGLTWRDWGIFPADWPASLVSNEMKNGLKQLLQEDFEGPLFVLKEPRQCRFLPIVEEALAGLGAEARYILPYRRADEVAASLKAIHDLDAAQARLLWLRYLIDAERATRGRQRVFFSYESFLKDWRQQIAKIETTLDIVLPAKSDSKFKEVDGFIEPQLKHHHSSSATHTSFFSAWLQTVHLAYQKLTEDPADAAAIAELDRIHNELALSTGAFYAPLQAAQERVDELERQEQSLTGQLDAMREQLSTLELQKEEVDKQFTLSQKQTRELGQQIRALEQKLDMTEQQAKEVDHHRLSTISDLEKKNRTLNVQMNELQVRNSESINMIDELSEKIKRKRKAHPKRRFKRLVKVTFRGIRFSRNSKNKKPDILHNINIGRNNFEDNTDPSADYDCFDAAWYLDQNPDIKAAGIDPLTHYREHGWRERRRPSPEFDTGFYLDQNPDVAELGIDPLLHYVRHGRAEGRKAVRPVERPQSVSAMIRAHNAAWAPLPVFLDRRAPPTLSIITDGVDANRLFGGVGTAIVVGASIARRLQGRLRLITRHDAPDPAALGQILRAHRIEWDGPTDFVHMPLNDSKPLPMGEHDILLTTSWWTTRAALGSVDCSRVLYLLQEDERMFYPFGDQRLLCAETLGQPNLRMLINSGLLFNHLADGPDPLPGLRDRGSWFEPAFPAIPRPTALEGSHDKQNFFFYSRPNNDRNLYWRGVEVIDAAIREGVLKPDQWNVYFVGSDLPDMELAGGVRPIVYYGLPWLEYAELVSRMDLGLCLMDTPHPSYPPIDLAAAGAVVVTNTHPPKTSLEHLSRNIIAVPPNVGALTEALRCGVVRAGNLEQRLDYCQNDNIERDWEIALKSSLDWIMANRN